MSELKPMTKAEACWAAVADDSITPPKPQTTEECILAAMSGNYPIEDIEPQTREQGLMKQAVDATQKAMVQNVEYHVSGPTASFEPTNWFKTIRIPAQITTVPVSALFSGARLEKIIIPKTVTAFSEFCGKTIEICKPEGSIEGAPWGATNAEVIWNG